MSFQAAQELDPTKFATADLTLGYDYNAEDPVFNVPFFAVEVGCFWGTNGIETFNVFTLCGLAEACLS